MGNQWIPNGQKDKYYFDLCRSVLVNGIYFNEWSMTIKRQLEIMKDINFESGIHKIDPIFQLRDFRIKVDIDPGQSSEEEKAWWTGMYYTSIASGISIKDGADNFVNTTITPVYGDKMISIISVNCTTINQEFNPKD